MPPSTSQPFIPTCIGGLGGSRGSGALVGSFARSQGNSILCVGALGGSRGSGVGGWLCWIVGRFWTLCRRFGWF